MENKRKILMVCEAFGGGVFAYVSQLCNDMCNHFDVFLAYALRPQTPKDFTTILDKRIHLIEVISVPLKSRQININQTIPEKGKN
ncbi:hypothetical protein [Phocaeicola coprophilus]|uniref:hypothetical protein n=1 Tax=Phocaeicola coprophilus TaxID=387090 RepID=UPI0039911D3D